MTVTVLVICLLLVCITEGIVIWRAARRLLQYDDIFQAIMPVLDDYGDALKKLLSAEGVLVDHPEVVKFHKLNRRAAFMLNTIVETVRTTVPAKKKIPELPRPDME